MTRFLKLVRHQNGSWQALPAESDDLAPVTLFETKDAPIDPVQLLKALAPLLYHDGGINSLDQAVQFSSLMKKFSKKLVSRCVYCNVLKATKSEILTKFLNEGGWETINSWLQDAKDSGNTHFLLELLKLCKILPMTVERLKENNTPKLVKGLTKLDNDEIKSLSSELVTKWMTIIKGVESVVIEEKVKKKKKIKTSKDDKEQKDPKKPDKIIKDSVVKSPARIKGRKRSSSDKDAPSKSELYEDVKIKIDPEPVSKKPKIDRPKTAKLYQRKFRATGLEEETPLPKNVSKKTSTVDKNVVAAAAKNAAVKRLGTTLPERITEKKLKPESLMTINEAPNPSGGIKLIPAKPRPAHILCESASFMDALVAQPAAPLKRKKKPVTKPSTPPTPTPPSPTQTPPKLQFYKDTLEMKIEEGKEEVTDKEPATDKTEDEEKEKSPSSPSPVKEDSVEISDEAQVENPGTPINDTAVMEEALNKNMADEAKKAEEDGGFLRDPNQLRSILSHGRRRHQKKSVKWVDDCDLKQVFFFELDETERVNVLHTHNFGDMKTLEAKREREAFEHAKRHAGDKMEESIPWWDVPIFVDGVGLLVDPGFQSKEREIQCIRHRSILQEIYFTREMVPDSPQEPDPESVILLEPKIIPLDEENAVGSLMDYSTFDVPPPKLVLPEVLTSLIKIPTSRMSQPNAMDQSVDPSLMLQQLAPVSIASPYDPGDPVGSSALLGMGPLNAQQMYNPQPQQIPETESSAMANDWRGMDVNMYPTDPYYGAYPMNSMMMMDPMAGMNRGSMRPRMNGPMMAQDMFHQGMGKQQPPPQHHMNRIMGPVRGRGVPRVPCRHFMAGNCRFGVNCSFLHSGVNGP